MEVLQCIIIFIVLAFLISFLFFAITKKRYLKNTLEEEQNIFNYWFSCLCIVSFILFLIYICNFLRLENYQNEHLETYDKVIVKESLQLLENDVYMIANNTSRGKYNYFALSEEKDSDILKDNYIAHSNQIVLINDDIDIPYKETIYYSRKLSLLNRLFSGIKEMKKVETKYYIKEEQIKFEVKSFDKGGF